MLMIQWNSLRLLKVIDNQKVDILNVTWQTVETNPRENQGCYGTVNDEVITTYSIQKYAPFGYEESEYYFCQSMLLKISNTLLYAIRQLFNQLCNDV